MPPWRQPHMFPLPAYSALWSHQSCALLSLRSFWDIWKYVTSRYTTSCMSICPFNELTQLFWVEWPIGPKTRATSGRARQANWKANIWARSKTRTRSGIVVFTTAKATTRANVIDSVLDTCFNHCIDADFSNICVDRSNSINVHGVHPFTFPGHFQRGTCYLTREKESPEDLAKSPVERIFDGWDLAHHRIRTCRFPDQLDKSGEWGGTSWELE